MAQVLRQPVDRLSVKTHLCICVVVLVKINCAELEVLWKRTDIDLNSVVGTANDDILDYKRCTTRVTGFVKPYVELLESQTVLSSDIKSLLNFQRFELTVLNFDDWLQDVNARTFKPGITPLSEIEVFAYRFVSAALIRFSEAGDKVGKCCVAPLVSLEVEMEACTHSVVTKDVVKLLQEGRALAVGDSIKERLSLVSGDNLTADWVSRAQAVFRGSPEFVLEEGDPACSVVVFEFGALAHSEE